MEQLTRVDLLKKITQAWEVAPHWPLGRLINYLLNFCDSLELYNVPDSKIAEACDGIVRERDVLLKTHYTKGILFDKLKPTPDTYFEIARQILVTDEYDKVVTAIIDPDVYQSLPPDLKSIVDHYFDWSVPLNK